MLNFNSNLKKVLNWTSEQLGQLWPKPEKDFGALNALPEEVRLHIFSFLPSQDLKNSRLTSRAFKNLSEDPSLHERTVLSLKENLTQPEKAIERVKKVKFAKGLQFLQLPSSEITTLLPQVKKEEIDALFIRPLLYYSKEEYSQLLSQFPHLKRIAANWTFDPLELLQSHCPHLESLFFHEANFLIPKHHFSTIRSPLAWNKLNENAFPKLTTLHYSFKDTHPETLKKIAQNCPQLEELTLSGYQPQNFAEADLSFFPHLKKLSLKFCDLSEAVVQQLLKNCPKLETFTFISKNTPLTDAVWQGLNPSLHLKKLNLMSNSLTDRSLSAIAPLFPNLLKLNLRHNQLTNQGICNLPKKAFIHLQNFKINWQRGELLNEKTACLIICRYPESTIFHERGSNLTLRYGVPVVAKILSNKTSYQLARINKAPKTIL